MQPKDFLIKKLLHHPLEFTEFEFKLLVNENTGLNFDDLRGMVMKIYNINESILLEESSGNTGNMGRLNRCETASRQKKYLRKIRQGFRTHKENRLIVSEGDSWFQYPIFVVKDIINNLSNYTDILIYNLAFAGDWLTKNILKNYQYINRMYF